MDATVAKSVKTQSEVPKKLKIDQKAMKKENSSRLHRCKSLSCAFLGENIWRWRLEFCIYRFYYLLFSAVSYFL